MSSITAESTAASASWSCGGTRPAIDRGSLRSSATEPSQRRLKLAPRGFEVLGFPCDQFGHQEPGNEAEIQSFCSTQYGVSFPMFAKISVKGADIHPLYKFLTSKETDPEFGGDITWNFNKFLVDRNGKIIARFQTGEKPEGEKVTQAIEKALK